MPENKVDYTGIQIPDIESIRRTSKQFEDWRKSMGFKTQEEKTQEMYQKVKEAQANIPEDMNSEDVYMWYNNYQHDPKKQAEFRQQGAKGAGALMTIPMTVLSAGTMGWVPALTTTATGMVGGYGGYKAGEYLDKKLGTNWIAPTLGFVGGMAGGSAGYKGLVNLGSRGLLKNNAVGNLYSNQFAKDAGTVALNRQLNQKGKTFATTINPAPVTRFKVGDIEIDDPNLYYRQGTREMGDDFLRSGIVREGTTNHIKPKFVGTIQLTKKVPFKNPMFAQGKLWYGMDSEMTDLLVANPSAKMQMANQHASPTTVVSRAGVRRIPREQLTSNDVTLYRFEPNYGFRQVNNSSNTSYKFFERPSTYFKDARYPVKSKTYGSKEVPAWQLPKGQRNQPISVRTPSQEYSNSYISAKMNPRKPMWEYEDVTENYFRDNSADELNKRLKWYVSYARRKGSSQYIDDHIVRGYRNYLHHLDFDAKDLSDDELRIILSKHFADLSKSASGKMKDQIVWHSSPTWFDEFDYRYTGTNMENSGAMGPGNYFSKEATMYGRGKRKEFSGKYDMGNTQPYVITDVMSTPSGKDMQDKGLLPTIIQKYRGRDKFGNKWDPDPEFDAKLKAQIDAVPSNDNKMYVLEGTDSGFDKLYQGPFGTPSGELMIRRNTGIKSLYPHPSRFVRDEDGFVHLITTNWDDPRVNFEKGGKINPQQ